jgi:hypothetical protein
LNRLFISPLVNLSTFGKHLVSKVILFLILALLEIYLPVYISDSKYQFDVLCMYFHVLVFNPENLFIFDVCLQNLICSQIIFFCIYACLYSLSKYILSLSRMVS